MKIINFSEILRLVLVIFATGSTALNQVKLDGGNFNVSWSYLSASQDIEFEVRARTTGYVALGLTKTNSDMRGLDLFVGGVSSVGNYLKDYSAEGEGSPTEDTQPDYTLISASESNGITMVHCKRKLDTQDENDFKIQPGDKMYIAWAIGSTDSLGYHGSTQSNRGYSILLELVPVPQTTSSPTTATPTTAPSITYNKEISFQAGNFLVFWKYESNTNELFFKVVVKATGWVGLGFSNFNTLMKDMDVVVAGVSGGQGYIGDYYSTSKTTPPRDSSQDYTLLSATESSGTTTVEFKRRINTGDDKDLQIVPGASYYIGWAYHNSGDSLQYHSARNYSPEKVVFIQAIATKATTTPIPSPTTTSAIPPSTTTTTSAMQPTTTTSAIQPTTTITAIPPSTTTTTTTTIQPTTTTSAIQPTTTVIQPPPTTTEVPSATTPAMNASISVSAATSTLSPNTSPPAVVYNKELAFKSGDFYMFWKFDSNTNDLFFKLTVKATGWIGLGFSEINSGMSDMDSVIAGVSGGQSYYADYYSTGIGTPPRDSSQDYSLLSATESAGTTIIEFKRKINTGDDKDLQIKPGASYYICWAYHSSSDSLEYHSYKGYSGKVVLVAAATGGGDTTTSTTPTTQTHTPTTTATMKTGSVVLMLLGIFTFLGLH